MCHFVCDSCYNQAKGRKGERVVTLRDEGQILVSDEDGTVTVHYIGPCTLAIRRVEKKAKVVRGWRCRPGWIMCNRCKELQPCDEAPPAVPVCRKCGAEMRPEDLPGGDDAR